MRAGGTAGLFGGRVLLCYITMAFFPSDPLALAAGTPARLGLVAAVLVLLWGAVAWALAV